MADPRTTLADVLLSRAVDADSFAPSLPVSNEERRQMFLDAERDHKEYLRTKLNFGNAMRQVEIAGSPSSARSGSGFGRGIAAKNIGKFLGKLISDRLHEPDPVPVRHAGQPQFPSITDRPERLSIPAHSPATEGMAVPTLQALLSATGPDARLLR